MVNMYKKYSDRLHQSQRHDVLPGRILTIEPCAVRVFCPRNPTSDPVVFFNGTNYDYECGDIVDIKFCLGGFSNIGLSPRWVQEQFEREFPAEEFVEG